MDWGYVTHRIGGLEKSNVGMCIIVLVTHRIGGLEIYLPALKPFAICYTPHRWLRKSLFLVKAILYVLHTA